MPIRLICASLACNTGNYQTGQTLDRYESIELFLHTIEEEYRGEARRVHAIAINEGLLLDTSDIKRLASATARAQAAKKVQNALTLMGDAITHETVLRRVSYLLEEALQDSEVNSAALGVYFDILRRLRLFNTGD